MQKTVNLTGRKIAAIALSAVLLVGGSVAGTMAYLTDTDDVLNTFTVGDVQITLDEAAYVDGKLTDGRTDVGNKYKLLPGHTYVKDPTVTVLKGSDESYVRVLVTINEQADLDAIFAPDGLDLTAFFGELGEGWDFVGDSVNGDSRVYEFRYSTTVTALDKAVELPALFETITIPSTVDHDDLASISDLQIKVVAQAIQADGFGGDANKAWSNWDGENL